MAGTVRDNALIGQVVANYRVGPLLGRGGMGAVYEVTHQYLGRRAALKVLHSQFARTPDLASRFVNEARAANLVQHSSVVSVFEIGQLPDGTPYILMEYLDGQPLSQRIRELATRPDTFSDGSTAQGRMTARIVWSSQLVRQLASALHALHERGVIHRDLKPDNVVIIKDPEAAGGERAKLLDFGIAKIVGEFAPTGESPFPGVPAQIKTALGALLGTPIYMGPEQWRGKGNVDHRTDIYALGCIFYELITGSPPYCASALMQLMEMHVRQKPPSALFDQSEVPKQLAELVQRMLAKEPGERPSTAQVDRELGQILVKLQTPAAPARPAQQAATVLMRPDILPSEDDTIPVVRLKANQVKLTTSSPGEPLPAAEPWPPLVDRKRPPLAAQSADAGVAPLVKRTASGSAQLVALSPARKGLRSTLLTAPGAVLVIILILMKLLHDDPPPPPPTPPTPATAAQLGVSWVIRSSPAGANVYADEDKTILLGQTPFLYQDPKHPLKKMILSLPGYGDRHISPDWKDYSPIMVKLRPTKILKLHPAAKPQHPEPKMNSSLISKVGPPPPRFNPPSR